MVDFDARPTSAARGRAVVVTFEPAPPPECLDALTAAGFEPVVAAGIPAALALLASEPADPIVVGPGPAAWQREACLRLRLSHHGEGRSLLVLGARAESESVMALVGDVADNALLLPAEPGTWAARLRLCVLRRRAREHAAAQAASAENAAVIAALEHLPDFVLLVEADGTVVFVSRGGPRYSREQVQGGSLFELTPPDRRETLRRLLAEAIETRRPVTYEHRLYDRISLVRIVPVPGAGRALVVSTDVTAWRRAEEAMRASDARADAIVDALPDLYFRISADGVYREVRARDPGYLRSPPDRLLGTRLADVLPADIAATALAATERTLATRELQVFEYELPTPSGATHFEARLVVSGPDEVLAVVRDMTPRRRLEAQILAADRMASLGTLAAGIAHEVNNPLAYVLLNLRHVASALGAVPAGGLAPAAAAELRGRVEAALEGVEQVSKIVGDLRTLARGDVATLTAMDVHGALDAAVAAVHAGVASRGRIERRYGDVPFVRASGPMLGQVFVNLLTNALQALPAGEAARNEVRLTTGREGDRVWVEVRDNGEGISEGVRARIFDPFFTTRPPGEGTGLGLWICQRIVQTLRGSITVESQPGLGSVFRVHLPAAFPG